MLIPNCTPGKDVDLLATNILNRGSGTVGPIKPGLTDLNLVHGTGPYVVLYALSIVHDYTLCFIGSCCCSVSYYNYISI